MRSSPRSSRRASRKSRSLSPPRARPPRARARPPPRARPKVAPTRAPTPGADPSSFTGPRCTLEAVRRRAAAPASPRPATDGMDDRCRHREVARIARAEALAERREGANSGGRFEAVEQGGFVELGHEADVAVDIEPDVERRGLA